MSTTVSFFIWFSGFNLCLFVFCSISLVIRETDINRKITNCPVFSLGQSRTTKFPSSEIESLSFNLKNTFYNMSTTKTSANKSVKPFRSNSSPFLSPHEYEKGLQSKFMEQILFYFLSSNNNVSRKVSISIDKVSQKKTRH